MKMHLIYVLEKLFLMSFFFSVLFSLLTSCCIMNAKGNVDKNVFKSL